MNRTAGRVLPSGRLSEREVVGFGIVSLVAGTIWLAVAVNVTTAALGLLTWALYVWVYTPMKTRTSLNTMVGAVGGALPMLMGWAATGAKLDILAFTLFMVLYLWQFPHFMAIAWIYREDYARAGMQMLPTIDPTGRLPGRQAVASALTLLPVSLLPVMVSSIPAPALYFAWSLVLGVVYLGYSIRFLVRRDDTSARGLLRWSLVYLPALLMLLLLTLEVPLPTF